MFSKSKNSEVFEQKLLLTNIQQREAIENTEGPVLVVAGPGTGKTQILALRIGNILKNTDASPHNILCLTYTEAGSVAMRQRLISIIGADAHKVHIHTFHSFCNTVIQENRSLFGMSSNLKPISELESIDIFYEIINDLPYGNVFKNYTGNVYSVVSTLKDFFNSLKKENLEPDYLIVEAKKHIESLPFDEEFYYKINTKGFKKGDLKTKAINEITLKIEKFIAAVELFKIFNEKMYQAERYDFNDMIQWVINAFITNDFLLGRYQEQYLYILVDEFQDTNGSQNEILNLLTSYWGDTPNIFAVGDDDQSIYSFQGAENKRISTFIRKYADNLQAIVLTQNYRSTQSILDAAKATIQNNTTRLIHDPFLLSIFNQKKVVLNKNLLSNKDISAQCVHIRAYTNTYHEAAHIVKEIENCYKNGDKLSEIAILYHNHNHILNMIKAFDVLKIPYNINQRINVLKLPIISKIITILQYILAENKEYDSGNHYLAKILHFDFFDIDTQDIALISLECYKNKLKWRKVISDKNLLFKWGITSLQSVETIHQALSFSLKSLHNDTLQVFFEHVLHQFGIMKYCIISENKIEHIQAINTFFDFLKEESEKNPSITLFQLLGMIDKMNINNIKLPIEQITIQQDGVHFITAHSSKGLEFETVYIINAEKSSWEDKRNKSDKITFPPLKEYTKPSKNKDIEEERRLFYVAMTRAKHKLYISYPIAKVSDISIENSTLQSSQFIAEIIDDFEVEIEKIALDDQVIIDFVANNFEPNNKIDINLAEKSLIAHRLANYKLSATHLNKFLYCPISFYFEIILQYPQASSADNSFGIAVHYALELLFKNMLLNSEKHFPTKDQFLYYFKQGMTKNASHFTEDQYELKKEYGESILPIYYDYYINDWQKNVVVEHNFLNIEVDGIPLTGKVDKIEIHGKDINVVDYKTGKSKKAKEKMKPPVEDADPETDTYEKVYGGDYWRQIVFYSILLDSDKLNNWQMTSGEINFLEKTPENTFEKLKYYVTPQDVSIVKKQISTVYDSIMMGNFHTGCGKESCRWCSFVKDNNLVI